MKNISSRNLKEIKNKFKGESICIVGNGPSLSKVDLSKIRYKTMAMNRISLLYEEQNWLPDFFVCTTINAKTSIEWRDDIIQSLNLVDNSFVSNEILDSLPTSKSYYSFDCKHGNLVCPKPTLDLWTENCDSEPISKFGTSLLVACQLSIHMGFKCIYLIGCDLGFKEISYLERGLNKIKKFSIVKKIESNIKIFKRKIRKSSLKNREVNKDHFSSFYDTPGLPGNLLNKNMLVAHKVLSMASKKYKFQVFNCTLGGYLDIHPRIPLDYILKDS